jgi:hypothetical protein
MKKAILLLLTAAAISSPALAQKKKKDKKDEVATPATPAPPAKSSKLPSIDSKTKNCIKIEGIFTLYRDTTNGQLFMAIKKDQLDKEYIHFTYTENGVLDAGFHKGQFRGSRVFKVKKVYDNIEFEQQNTQFYFDPSSTLSRSASTNISNAPLAFEKIQAVDEKTGEYLVDADELFLTEKLHQIKPTPRPGPGGGFSMGMLSKPKTRYESVRNYPANMDLVVRYVFDNPYPSNGGSEPVTDARSVVVTMQHSIIAMPQNEYQPRFDDPRIGYFAEEVNDMTTTDAVNYRDLIHRWNLVKKDPTAEKSEPVQPIVWWIENTTPMEYRPIIKNAAMQWNKAFEPLGFINAVQIFEQPDTATWDAGDIRYNVLRWTSSPQPPFGGYGPSFVNPRTGEILGADIMFEYIFVTNRVSAEKLFEIRGSDQHYCEAGHQLHAETQLGMQMLQAAGASEIEMTRLIQQSLHYLVLHEMGHTLGLQHNMKASQLLSPAELKNYENTQARGLIGSVMDYPALNLHHNGNDKIDYCQTEPGPYDLWAIEFGYSVAASSPEAEAERLQKILARSGEKNLTFGNDADDMRSPGKGIDPRVMINDLSGDAITYSTERIEMVQKLMPGLLQRYGNSGESYQELRNAYGSLMGGQATMLGVISRYVGGVYVERVAPGSAAPKQPYTPVSYTDQKRAMKALAKYAFAPNAMDVPDSLAPYLQKQRRGYNFFADSEDPKLHDQVENAQMQVLMHLLSPSVLQRLTDSREYGNLYSVGEMMTDLSDAIFKDDMAGSVNSHRQVLQINYVKYLTAIAGFKNAVPYDNISQARATAQLLDLQKKLKLAVSPDKDTRDHRTYLLELIDKAFDK